MGRPSAIAATRRGIRLRRGAWIAAVLLLVVSFGAWLRDSSLVAVKHVEVQGITGRDRAAVERALTTAGLDMTTLHVRENVLRTAVEPFPAVAAIDVSRKLPNRLIVRVDQRRPVAVISAGGIRQAVAGDGVILRGAPTRGVPTIPASIAAAGDRVTGRRELQALRLLDAAPAALRPRIVRLRYTAEGIVVLLSKGPELRFGTAGRPLAKWLAISRVLADGSSRGATYIDAQLPERPAAGGLEDPATQHDPRTAAEATPPAVAEESGTSATVAPPQVGQTTPQPSAQLNSQ